MKKILFVLLNLMFLYSCSTRQMRIEDVEAPKKSEKGDGYIFIDELFHTENNFYRRKGSEGKLEIIFETKKDDVEKIMLHFGSEKYLMRSVGTLGQKEYFSIEADLNEEAYYFELLDGNFRYFYGKTGAYSKEKLEKLTYSYKETAEEDNYLKGEIWYKIYVDSFRNGNEKNDPLFNEFGPESYLASRVEFEGENTENLIKNWGSRKESENLGRFATQSWAQDFNRSSNWENKAEKLYPWSAKSTKRFGGDLEGIEEKFDYLEELGISALWLSPVFYSYSGNKNDIIDYRHISPDYGTLFYIDESKEIKVEYNLLSMKDSVRNNLGESLNPSTWKNTESDKIFIDFLNKLKKRNMKLMLDVNYDYVSYRFFAFDRVLEEGPESIYADWFLIRGWEEADSENIDLWNKLVPYEGSSNIGIEIREGKKYRRSFIPVNKNYEQEKIKEIKKWNMEHMDYGCYKENKNLVILNLANKKLREYLFESAAKWLTYGLDAYCVDYSEEKKEFYEAYESYFKDKYSKNPLIYNYLEDVSKEDINGAYLNYHTGASLYKYLGSNSKNYAYSSEEFLTYLEIFADRRVQNAKLNMLDSNYTDRFLSALINPDREFDENNKQNINDYLGIRPDIVDSAVISKFKSAVIVQYSLYGSPVIYYGSEKAMWGGDVPHNRKAMLWDDHRPYVNESDNIEKYLKYKDKLSDKVIYDEVSSLINYDVKSNEELFEFYKKLNEVYRSYSDVFLKGEFKSTLTEEGLVIYERSYDEKKIIVAINNTDKKITMEYEVDDGKEYYNPFGDKKIGVVAGGVEIDLEAKSGLLLIKN